MNLYTEALAWHLRGYTPLPIRPDGSKAPAVTTWRDLMTNPPTTTDLEHLFAVDHDGLGLICGAASGHLEMLELEGRAIREGVLTNLIASMADHDATDLWDRITGGYVELTPSGGIHYHYRVGDGPAARNTKLARRPSTPDELAQHPAAKVQVLIETRGEGGFTVVAPSGGRTHPTGRPWAALTGSMDTIPTITTAERDLLHAVATLHDQMPARDIPTHVGDSARDSNTTGTSVGKSGRPGDDYNARATWTDILTPHGWTLAWRRGTLCGWTRPGKHPSAGISATSGRNDADNLYVFSSSTEFEPEEPYSKFAALAILEHGGDYAACARRLAADGWGAGTDPTPALTIAPNPPGHSSPAASDTITPSETRGQVIAFPGARQAITDGATALAVNTTPTQELTDAGNADTFAQRHHSHLRYVPARAQWISWQGTHWQPCDDDGEATQAARDTIRALPTGTDAARNHRNRSLSRRGIASCVALASRHEQLRVPATLLDADPWTLNTPTGLVNLRDGTLRPTTPEDLCTRITAAPYQPGAPAPRWEQFLDETFAGDREMIDYFQRLVGYSACGAVTHHVLPFAFGSGANGKSVALDVTTGALGTYASTAPSGFLMAGHKDESAIARLAGLRMVIGSEVSQSAKFDEAKVKLLTGGDTLTSRFLFGQYFSFVPSHTLWLMGNHQPRVEAGGESFWRRLRILPFAHTVPREKRIEGLDKQLLAGEGPGILDWIVRGATQVLADGLREPERVMAATQTYADEEDALARFVADRISLTGGREDTASVRAAYLKWCKAEGEQEVSPQVFGRELRARWGVSQVRSNGRRYYAGMTLCVDVEEPDDDDGQLRWDQR